jgi:DNA-binding NarL/FixJ family response regulator
VETYRGIGRPLAAYPLARLATLRARQGRLEEAEQLVAGWEGHPEMGPVTVLLHLERGQTTLAAARLEQQLRRTPPDGPGAVPLLPLLARLRLAEEDVAAAGEAAKAYEELAARLGHTHLRASSQVLRAEVDAALGRDTAVPLLESAIDLYLQLRMPYDEAVARLGLATVVAARQPELAISEARSGLGIFARLGAARAADRAAELLRSLGARGPGAPHTHDDLTQREREVLALLEHGLTNPEIAERLFIAPKTAAHHVSRILAKLGVRTRAEAAAFAARERAERPRR